MNHTGVSVLGFVAGAGLLLASDVNAGSLEPPGPPAPTMKTVQQVEPRIPILSLPFTIASPGSYYLTSDLTGSSGQSGITINSSFVTVDLNTFTLLGVPGSNDGIRATVAGTKQVTIRNGTVRGWGGVGISMQAVTDAIVEGVRADTSGSSGISLGNRAVVRGTSATNNGALGIVVLDGAIITGCTVAGNVSHGINTGAAATVSGTTALGNLQTGFQLGAAATVTDCTAQANNGGFNLGAGGHLVHSVARSNVVGAAAGDGSSIVDCTVTANTDDGIRLTSGTLARGNVTHGNTNDGIQAFGSRNRIEENESTSNGIGIRIDGTSNVIVKNSVGGNTSAEYFVVPSNQLGPISTDPATAGPWANFDL